MPVTDKTPATDGGTHATAPAVSSMTAKPRRPDDGTHALIQAGSWIMLVAALSLIATLTLFGGIGIDGPHTNAGWLAFMFALMGIPFALMLLVLGVAKWLRNRRLYRKQD